MSKPNYTERMARRAFYFAMALMMALALTAACSCTRKVYTEQLRVQTDTVVKIHYTVSHDTVRISERLSSEVRDSIAPVLDSAGRVVAYDRWHWRYIGSQSQSDRSSLHTSLDSLKQSGQNESVVEKRVEVERPLSATQWLLSYLGLAFIAFAVWVFIPLLFPYVAKLFNLIRKLFRL